MAYVSLSLLGLVAVGLPLFGFLFAIIWSILYDWEASCRTRCHAVNYLPTVSSAIGGFKPQRYVWRMCIMLHAGLRFLLVFCYYHWHMRIHVPSYNSLYSSVVKLAILSHTLENIALITLTAISSTDNGEVHEDAFITFMVCSQVYMLLSCILIYWTHRSGNFKPTFGEKGVLKFKTFLFVFNFSVFQIAIYLYFRHNSYCEPYIYTWFALFEYLTILSNIVFHGLCCVDFRDYSFTFLPTEDIRSGMFKNR